MIHCLTGSYDADFRVKGGVYADKQNGVGSCKEKQDINRRKNASYENKVEVQ